jgi:two-component system sensor histidine kinase/response regulator
MDNKPKLLKRTLPRIILISVVMVFSIFYIRHNWIKTETEQIENILHTARSIGASIPIQNIQELDVVPEDIDKEEYQSIKQTLMSIIKVNPEARFAYLYAEKSGKIYFMVDSEPETSEDYSPPGQEYTEAQAEDQQPFRDGKERLTKPLTDRWGTWMSAYIPIRDTQNGKIIAVLGMDFNAESWNRTLVFKTAQSSLVLIIVMLLALMFIIRIQSKNKLLNYDLNVRKKAEEDLLRKTRMQNIIIEMASNYINISIDKVNATVNESLRTIGEFIFAESSYIFRYDNGSHTFSCEYAWKKGSQKNEAAELQNLDYRSMQEMADAHQEGSIHSFPDISSQPDNPFFNALRQQGGIRLVSFPLITNDGCIGFVCHVFNEQARDNEKEEILLLHLFAHMLVNVKKRAESETTLIQTNKDLELATIKANEMAEKAENANKSKSAFLANMSHEIRTPLNAIIGFSQLINRDKLLTETQKEYNLSIIRAGEHLLALINDILELSKIEAGRVVLNPANVDLHLMLSDIQMIFKDRAESKHLQFICEIDDQLPKYAFIDEGKLRQIFVNLIGNAIKFTEEGGIAIRTRTNLIDQEKKMLTVEIQDSGPGIPEEELGKLFKHFEQTSSGRNKGSGTGLGLALSKELAMLMGGNIHVSSEVGKGSIFTFQVEIMEGNPEAVQTMISRRVIGIADTKKTHRILAVDDKPENLKVVVNLLRMIGFETQEAVNGKEAIEQFESWNPDLILMDMRMPVMDGYEATRRIKETEKGRLTPIIALTASAFEDERKKIEALGMQGYIRKPFKESELFNIIGKILNIEYIYEDENATSDDKSQLNKVLISQDIHRLPPDLILEMAEAISVADLDQFIELVKKIEPDNADIAEKLIELAKNYEYNHLQLLLN